MADAANTNEIVWTVKAFPEALRDKAVRAAQAANMPVGAWLAAAVAQAIEQDDKRGG